MGVLTDMSDGSLRSLADLLNVREARKVLVEHETRMERLYHRSRVRQMPTQGMVEWDPCPPFEFPCLDLLVLPLFPPQGPWRV